MKILTYFKKKELINKNRNEYKTEIMNIIDLKYYLKFEIDYIMKLIELKIIPFFQINDLFYFKKSEIDIWIYKKLVLSNDELNLINKSKINIKPFEYIIRNDLY